MGYLPVPVYQNRFPTSPSPYSHLRHCLPASPSPMAHHPLLKPSSLRRWLSVLTLGLILFYTVSFLLLPSGKTRTLIPALSPPCDPTTGRWSRDLRNPNRSLYDSSCPFQRNAWNCLRNGRDHMEEINSWVWVPDRCGGDPLPRIDPGVFLEAMRGRRIGFVGDSLNENFFVALLCTLRSADGGARKWKRKGAWRGGYFPKFDVIVGYHRAVLLAKYTWQPVEHSTHLAEDGIKGIYKVDVDIAADDWANVTKFYDVLVFNTGHWWGPDKFPKETPLVFYSEGRPIKPPLGIFDGLKVVLRSMVSYVEREVPKSTLKLWRTQSPRHFYGGEWDHNGSCLFDEPLKQNEK
ncbi:protein trichome birefringence-like 12 isoform X3 [Typha angustifolia]|uniref:protein trichome birefringence-like 12 isoform X3 n=1 Tax=Typha angustifolia TaxID=59011 RepID=UPI003C2CCE0D